MEATPQRPPIFWLNDDLLLYILEMNANMFLDKSALKTTCTTSQVCRSWRNFMLSTPSLWAKLIDLNSLQYCTTDTWRNELMRRTGTALLWITAQGNFIDYSTGIISFFFDVISKHWQRIQKIIVQGIDSRRTTHPRPRWNPLYLPAPNLQTFYLHFCEGDSPSENVDGEYVDAPLFSNYAPMLREFEVRGCRFDLGAPWLRHLHVLHIDIKFTMNEILTALKRLPHLMDLRIQQVVFGEVTPSLPVISLPTLSRLKLFSDFAIGTALLDHLELPLGCEVTIYLSNEVNNPTEEVCRSCMQTISRIARNIFQHYQPQKLEIICCPDSLSLEAETQAGERRFYFHVSSIFLRVSNYMTTMFLRALTLLELSKVTELCFDISISHPASIFGPFIARLSSVRVLEATGETICCLVDLQDELDNQDDRPIVIFPLVKTVILKDGYDWPDEGTVFKFFLTRIRNGRPIDMLDITNCTAPGLFSQVDFPKEMTGVKVLWKIRRVKDIFEYICGSGHPDRLRTCT